MNISSLSVIIDSNAESRCSALVRDQLITSGGGKITWDEKSHYLSIASATQPLFGRWDAEIFSLAGKTAGKLDYLGQKIYRLIELKNMVARQVTTE